MDNFPKSVSCRLCNSLNVKKIFNTCNIHGRHILDSKDNFSIYRCYDCEIIFIADVLIDSEYYSKYYPQNYYNKGLNNNLVNLFINLIEKISIKIKERQILNNFSNIKFKLKILDMGCGDGRFLANINNSKFDKYGVEINPEGYKICKEKKLKVYNQELKDINFEENVFDVITLWHVIEHLDRPNEIMLTIRMVLKKGGILVLSTPNTDSLGFKYGQNIWFHLDTPRHLMLYNKKSIKYLLESTGFKVIEERNAFYDFPFDLFWSIRKSLMKYLIYPFYPFFKYFSKESILFICKKENEYSSV